MAPSTYRTAGANSSAASPKHVIWRTAVCIISALLGPSAAHALQVFSSGLEVPTTISRIPDGFGGLGGNFLVPDTLFPPFLVDDQFPIRMVPAAGGSPSVFYQSTIGSRGGMFLPADFGAWGGMYLTGGFNQGEYDDFVRRRTANPNDPGLYPFTRVGRIVAIDSSATAHLLAEYEELFVDANNTITPPFFPRSFQVPVLAPATFGGLAGDVLFTAQSAGVGRFQPSGEISQFVSRTVLEDVEPGNGFVQVFGAAFAPSTFGAVGGKLLVSEATPVNPAVNDQASIFAIDALGNASVFTSVPMTQAQINALAGLRQMAFAPDNFGAYSGMLLVSVSGSLQGGSGILGQLLVIDSSGNIAARLKVGTEFDKFDPRGLYFTDDGRLLISDASDPILIATPADFEVVPDYNADGNVDAADYVVWRKNDGTQIGYDTWRTHFGATTTGIGVGNGAASGANGSANAGVPEPTSLALAAAILPALILYRPRSGIGHVVAKFVGRRQPEAA